MTEQSPQHEPQQPPTNDPVPQLKQMATIGYALYALGCIFPVAYIASLILAYIKRGEARGTYVESHFTWQISTFWVAFIIGIVSFVTMFIGIGFIIYLVMVVWVIYRIIKGWLALADNRPVV